MYVVVLSFAGGHVRPRVYGPLDCFGTARATEARIKAEVESVGLFDTTVQIVPLYEPKARLPRRV